MNTEFPQEPSGNHSHQPDPEVVAENLKQQQNLLFAIVGGAGAALIGAIIWAVVTVATGYQIGYMAIAVGFIVGFSVRALGAGIDLHFGILGALFAFLGCAFGNLFSQIHFVAVEESLGYFEILPLLNLDIIKSIYIASFKPIDALFYGIAVFEGYKFAFREVTDKDLEEYSLGKLSPAPFSGLRIPVTVALLAVVAFIGYAVLKGSTSTKTHYYESGSKLASGKLHLGKEMGAWTFWHENGKIQQEGFFADAQKDSTWKYYTEEGKLYKIETYRKGILNGQSIDFYPDSTVQLKTVYHSGRQNGEWISYYTNGKIHEKGHMNRDLADGLWEIYYENGQIGSSGEFHKDKPVGAWTYWNEDGSRSQESVYSKDGTLKLMNTWDSKSKPVIVNGKGTFEVLGDHNNVMQVGSIENGVRVGRWMLNYNNGKKQEEGEYREGEYFVIDSWDKDGKPLVVKGEGQHIMYYESGNTKTSGKITKGVRSGKWTSYYEGTNVPMQEQNYVNGVSQGLQKAFYPNGSVQAEGNVVKDNREGEWFWYYEDKVTQSRVTFINGMKQGRQEFYDQTDGKLIRWEQYSNDELISEGVVAGEE